MRTKVSRARRAVIAGAGEAIDNDVRSAVRALDRAAEKGIIHRNNAARRKSRLTALAARLAALAGPEHAAERMALSGGQKGKATTARAKRT